MKLNVLVIEDDTDIMYILKTYIKQACPNSYIKVVDSARSALTLINNNSYDLIITDMGLKDSYVGGDDILEKAKRLGIFVAICSGAVFIPKGFDYILPKPFNLSDIEKLFKKFNTKCFVKKVHAFYRIVVKI